jgi:hypothetical protein
MDLPHFLIERVSYILINNAHYYIEYFSYIPFFLALTKDYLGIVPMIKHSVKCRHGKVVKKSRG